MSDKITVSARISELNLDQLLQVFNMAKRQQGALVQESQALGLQVDEIRAKRLELAAQIAKYTADLEALAVHIKAREAERDAAQRAAGATDGPTVADVLRVDATAPGVVLEASVSKA
jgi:chromosome segregation ATPase